MPFSPTLWMAASLLWILDAANNVTMEPYRAFVSDKLDPEQHSLGFLTQSAFTGLGQTLAYLTPSLLVWLGMNKDAVNGSHIPHIVIVAFMIGAVFSISSVLWTLKTTKENPLSEEELRPCAPAGRLAPRAGRYRQRGARDAAHHAPAGVGQAVPVVRHVLLLAVHHAVAVDHHLRHHRPGSQGFRDAGCWPGRWGVLQLHRVCRRAGAGAVHAPLWSEDHAQCVPGAGRRGDAEHPADSYAGIAVVPMVGIGLAWASIMGNPYVMLAGCIPPERTGVYMGIFNMFIVIPMIIQIFTLPLYYRSLLGGNPEM
jgi:maltose/moltooligosaccharide transporter